MRMWLAWLALVFLGACATRAQPQQTASAAGSSALAIVGVNVIPMTGAADMLTDHTVIVRDGRIAAMGPSRSVRIPAGARRIDGRGRYLMPGLADMHVHLEYVEDPDILKLFLANGVTTVRSMDGRPFILDWRDRVRSGALVGPRIVTAGPIIDGSPPLRDDNLAVADPAAARAAVADQAARGYDFIKLYTNLSPPAFEAAVGEAGRLGLRVAGHVPRGLGTDRAIASLWSIEHLGDFAASVSVGGATVPAWARRTLAAPLDGARLRALAQSLARQQVWVVPTAVQQDRALAPADRVEAWLQTPTMRNLGPQAVERWRAMTGRTAARMGADDWAMLERARQNRVAVIAGMREAGVRLAVGTDTPNPFVAPGESLHLELANFVAAGFSPLQALQAATIGAARMLSLEREQGAVAVGMRADLLLLTRNPLEDVANASAREGVVLAGRWIPEAQLREMAGDLLRR